MEIPDDIWIGLGLQINNGKVTASREIKECLRELLNYAFDISEVVEDPTGFSIHDGTTEDIGLPVFNLHFGFEENVQPRRENAGMWVTFDVGSEDEDVNQFWESGEAMETLLRNIRESECFAIQEVHRKKMQEIQTSVSEIAVKKKLPLGLAAKGISPLLTRYAGRKKKSRRQKKTRATRRR